MKLKETVSKQKLRGAYYTPLNLAEKMISFFINDKSIKTVLEPSCGDGVFFDAVISSNLIRELIRFDGIETEKKEVEDLKQRLISYSNTNILHKDFFDFYKENSEKLKYDLIVGNPPYIRYQYLTDSQRKELSEILISHNMKSNKLINAWVAFLVASVHLLSDTGKICFVIPAELLQVAYAEDLRYFLSQSLSNITLLTFQELVFPGIEQEIVIFLAEKKSSTKGIKIIDFKDSDEINITTVNNTTFQPFSNVHEKWTKYFTSFEENHLITEIKHDNRFQRLSDTAIINVGVTTGNNKYFSVSKDTVLKYELEKISLPLIGKSSHANSVYFTYDDWLKNVNSNKAAYLVNFSEKDFSTYTERQHEYINWGEKTEQNKGYKCKIRDNWYQIPSIWIPDAFFLRRNNIYPKFVLNCCEAISTDTMHRIKFNNGTEPERIVLSYYNSISFAFTEICGRSYGGGVLEILPGEVGNIYIPKLDFIPIQEIRSILKKIDSIIRNNESIDFALDLVDNKILIERLGVNKLICEQSRNIWKKLQKRRLTRS